MNVVSLCEEGARLICGSPMSFSNEFDFEGPREWLVTEIEDSCRRDRGSCYLQISELSAPVSILIQKPDQVL